MLTCSTYPNLEKTFNDFPASENALKRDDFGALSKELPVFNLAFFHLIKYLQGKDDKVEGGLTRGGDYEVQVYYAFGSLL